MTDNPKRVALLARPGAASERLRGVLADAGVEGVLDADPTTLDSGTLAASGAEVVLVALDAATEESLARFESVLGDPAINVIYEEADLIAAREVWDRHAGNAMVRSCRGHAMFFRPVGLRRPRVVRGIHVNGAAPALSLGAVPPKRCCPQRCRRSALSAPSNYAATVPSGPEPTPLPACSGSVVAAPSRRAVACS